MKIQITNLQKITKVKITTLKNIAGRIAQFLCLNKGSFSIVLTDDKQIRALNKKYFAKDSSTDVISFDLKDEFEPAGITGEIIISIETALANAKYFSTFLNEEIVLYLIHGFLHLCGLNDKTRPEKKKMREKEKIILKEIKKKFKKINL